MFRNIILFSNSRVEKLDLATADVDYDLPYEVA